MKKYIKANDEFEEQEDLGYGFDSNGEAIDESTVDELYRIAEQEILPNTELAKLGRVTIDEDTFDYYMTGSAWGARIEYTMYLETNEYKDVIDLESFVLPSAGLRPGFGRRNNYRFTASLEFNIYVEGFDKIHVELDDVSIYEKGDFDSYSSKHFAESFDVEAICEEIKKIAEPAVREIHRTLSDL